MTKILIGVPTLNSYIHASLLGMILHWNSKHYVGFMPLLGVQPVDEARNKLVEEFLKTDCTHIFFVDSDTIPPADALDKLFALNADVASGLTPLVNGGNATITKWNAVGADDKEIKPNTGIHRSRGVGASCLFIRRSVFEKIKKPYFRFTFKDDGGNPCYVSEDIFFCSLILRAGMDIKVDSSILCRHAKLCLF
jgi:hypothetical protein